MIQMIKFAALTAMILSMIQAVSVGIVVFDERFHWFAKSWRPETIPIPKPGQPELPSFLISTAEGTFASGFACFIASVATVMYIASICDKTQRSMLARTREANATYDHYQRLMQQYQSHCKETQK